MDRHDPHGAGRAVEFALDALVRAGHRPQEGGETRRPFPFMGKRPVQEGIEQLVHLRTQPGGEAGASPVVPEQTGEEFVDRQPVRPALPPVQTLARAHQRLVARRHGVKRVPQRTPTACDGVLVHGHAMAGKRVEDVLVEPEERTAQKGCERQVVIGHHHGLAGGDQILRGDVGAHLQPVRAGHRNARLLQDAGQLVDEGAPVAHQHHHVAVADPRTRHVLQPLAPAHPLAQAVADAVGKAHLLVGQHVAHGCRPVVGHRDGLALLQGPDLHLAPAAFARGGVVAVVAAGGQPVAALGVVEDRVHRRQHVQRGAERQPHGHGIEGPFHRLRLGLEGAPRLGEQFRRRPLEGVDGLLLVPHREDGARRAALAPIAGALAIEEGVGDGTHDAPLGGRGVLGLVHQHVVDPLVELVEHPVAGIAPGEQIGGARDQVVVVKQATPPLGRLVARQHVGAHAKERRGVLDGAQRRDPSPRRAQPLGFGAHQFLGPLHLRLHLLDEDGDAGLVLVCQEHLRPGIEPFGRPVVAAAGTGAAVCRLHQFQGRGLPLRRAGIQHGAPFLVRADALVEQRLGQPLRCLVPAEAVGVAGRLRHPVGSTVARQERDHGLAPAQNLPQRAHQARLPALCQHPAQGIAGGGTGRVLHRGHSLAPRLVGQRCLHRLVHGREGARNVRLQRKALQKPRAEGVDGLDVQAARRVQRTGEEGAGAGMLRFFGGSAQRVRKACQQVRPIHVHPGRQDGEDPGLHLGRGGAGEGEAQDRRRRDAGQQQTHHAPRQHGGLAGARIGRHPGGAVGIGGVRLRLVRAGVGGDGRAGAGAHDPSVPAGAALHSAVRAR